MSSFAPKIIVAGPLIVVLALMALGYWGERWNAAAQSVSVACGDELLQEQTRSAMFVALDDAFRQQVSHLYLVMMKDMRGTDRAKAGIDVATSGYLHGYRAVQAWRLPPC